MLRARRTTVAIVAVLGLIGVAAVIGVLGELDRGPASRLSDPVVVVPEPLRAPLTGLAVDRGTDLDHPAVAVKISDVRQAHPQAGVDRADIVFVEPIGVSYTRLAAVFHTDLPDLIGPVRSVRPMDAALLGPLTAVFGNTMGAPWVMDYVDSVAHLDDLGTTRVRGSGAYILDEQRSPPDHVFAKPRVLLELSEFTAAPEPYFGYAVDPGRSSAELAGGPGQSVVVPYGPSWQVTWTYDETAGRYLRDEPWGPHTMVDGTQVGTVNILVLEVASSMGKIGEGRGAPVPILQLVDSSGRFVALSGGHSVTGTWSKAGVNEPFELHTDSGEELELSPGNTWVELPAPSAGVTTR
jgi:hypothetical protein